MRNRYGNEYHFEKVDDNTYTIEGDLEYWRYGGKEGGREVDANDLGFVDPSGGPFISIGYEIEGKKVKRIFVKENKLHFEVEE